MLVLASANLMHFHNRVTYICLICLVTGEQQSPIGDPCHAFVEEQDIIIILLLLLCKKLNKKLICL